MSTDLNVVEHPRGQGDLSPLLANAPSIDFGKNRGLELENVRVHYCLFEAPMAQAKELIPPSLHPGNPAHMSITGYSVADSEIGPFEYAVIALGCRAGIKPHMLTLSSFFSTPAACEYFAENFGYDGAVANVKTSRFHHETSTNVELEGGRVILDVATEYPRQLLGTGQVKYPTPLNVAKLGDHQGLVRVDIGYEYRETERGEIRLRQFSAGDLTDQKLEPTNAISGASSDVGMQFSASSGIIDLETMASAGGLRWLGSK